MFCFVFVCVPQSEEKRNLSLGGHVGFDSLPDQLVSKSVTQGFCFNILCVGEWKLCSVFTWFIFLVNYNKIATLCCFSWHALVFLQYNPHVWELMNCSLVPVWFSSFHFLPSTGETGIGKSTLMNTLFNTMFENEEASHYQNGVYLRPRTYDLQESNVHLKLTIVDTVGFGDQINKEDRWGH